MTPSDVIEAVQKYGEPEIAALLGGLCGPCGVLATAPLDALLGLADAVAKAIQAKSELAQMQAAVKAADAAADLAEAAALAAPPGSLP